MVMVNGQMGIHTREKYITLGLDPGRYKTGSAFVNREGDLLSSGIFPASCRPNFGDDITARLNIRNDMIGSQEKYITLGLDPGRDKTGSAFVIREGDLLSSGIFPASCRLSFGDDITGEA